MRAARARAQENNKLALRQPVWRRLKPAVFERINADLVKLGEKPIPGRPIVIAATGVVVDVEVHVDYFATLIDTHNGKVEEGLLWREEQPWGGELSHFAPAGTMALPAGGCPRNLPDPGRDVAGQLVAEPEPPAPTLATATPAVPALTYGSNAVQGAQERGRLPRQVDRGAVGRSRRANLRPRPAPARRPGYGLYIFQKRRKF